MRFYRIRRKKGFRMKQEKITAKKFGFTDKIGYLFGDLGNDFTFVLSTTVLLKFYTDVMGVPAHIVGIVMMVARFVDAFTDVAMGRICDRGKETKAGKFKPWLLRMCLPVSVASFLIYQSRLATLSLGFRIFWLFFTYILWGSVFYTSINIPYGSMASCISPDPMERQSLSTYRSVGATLAGTVIGVVIPLFAFEKRGQAEVMVGGRVTLIAAIFSVLAILSYLLCYALVTERVRYENPASDLKQPSVFAMLAGALKNRALISIIAASVMMLVAQLTMQSMGSYLFPDYYQNASAQSVSTLVMTGGMLLAAAFVRPLAKKFGKAEISSVAALFAGLVSLLLYFLRPQSVWHFILLQSLSWLGLGIFSMVNWSLITDVIDDTQLRNGVREDGSVYALYSFARKMGQALASGLSGALLSLIGYQTSLPEVGVTQDEGVLQGLFDLSTLLPAVGFLLLALILWFFYPLRKQKVEANVRALEALRAKNEPKQEK